MTIEKILKNDLCTGCGVCISEDKSQTAKMVWSEHKFLVPSVTEASTQDDMYNVCPFKDNQLNEDVLGKIFFKSESLNYNEKIGYYSGLYGGYSKEFRETSSSGGIATYIFKQLLERKIVDHLFIVTESHEGFAYKLCRSIEDIKEISKTRYMPVTLENLFKEIENIDGKIALSGVACFVKAVRIKQEKYKELKEKIPFIVGIICGGLKSKYYTDYLAQSSGCFDDYESVEYRLKKSESFAIDYKFGCQSKKTKKIHMVEMRSVGDMWGTGLFKSNACDFCDDVVTELADISLGDAWIKPYSDDGRGNSIIIARSKQAHDLIKFGNANSDLNIDALDVSDILESQRGSYNHRHLGLKYRIDHAQKNGFLYPEKRSRFLEKRNILMNFVQFFRLKTRANSLKIWHKYQDVNKFNEIIKKDLKNLELVTTINRRYLRVLAILNKMIRG